MMPPAPTRHDSSGSPVSPRSAVPDVAVFSAKAYDRQFLDAANGDGICRLHYFEAALDADTVGLAAGHAVVCVFVNDVADAGVLTTLAQGGTRLLALRCTGFNNVDLAAARAVGIRVVRVSTYSPYSVAEHAVALLLALVRRIPRAWYRTRDGNFTLDGLLGFDLHGRTVAVVGTGRIGALVARLLWNPDVDIRAELADFLSGYYEEAGPHIAAYIDLMHDELIDLLDRPAHGQTRGGEGLGGQLHALDQ